MIDSEGACLKTKERIIAVNSLGEGMLCFVFKL